jgi:hypothetical protein
MNSPDLGMIVIILSPIFRAPGRLPSLDFRSRVSPERVLGDNLKSVWRLAGDFSYDSF